MENGYLIHFILNNITFSHHFNLAAIPSKKIERFNDFSNFIDFMTFKMAV